MSKKKTVKPKRPNRPSGVVFRDYVSAYEEARRFYAKQTKEVQEKAKRLIGFDIDDFESIYAIDIKNTPASKDMLSHMRLHAERFWHRDKRPYFNVYPAIEQKLLELSDKIDLSELHLPFKTIEVRTKTRTMLLSDCGVCFLFVHELANNKYEEFTVSKNGTILEVVNAKVAKIGNGWNVDYADEYTLGSEDREKCLFIAAGTCLLARDASIVAPVILNEHRRDNMTPAEIADYAERAKKRTGRVGFDVGRNIERMKATAHYRNGHFAKFNVGKKHPAYPPNATAHLVPIIQWRSGTIVNPDVATKVPTGFKDMESNNVAT